MAISSGGAATTGATVGTTATVTATTGISFETAAVVGFGMLIVGFVAGLLVISKFAIPKKPKS
jgi:hypothetical protein